MYLEAGPKDQTQSANTLSPEIMYEIQWHIIGTFVIENLINFVFSLLVALAAFWLGVRYEEQRREQERQEDERLRAREKAELEQLRSREQKEEESRRIRRQLTKGLDQPLEESIREARSLSSVAKSVGRIVTFLLVVIVGGFAITIIRNPASVSTLRYIAESSPTPIVTATPIPTLTDIPTSIPTSTSTDTPGETPTPRPTPTPPIVSATTLYSGVNLRSGPNLTYSVVGTTEYLQEVNIIGQNDTRQWYLLEIGAWIKVELVDTLSREVPIVSDDSTPASLDIQTPRIDILVNNQWVLVSYIVSDTQQLTLEGTVVSMSFNKLGSSVVGTTGCNNYISTYEVSGTTLKIAPLALTRKLCPEQGVQEQEHMFVSTLVAAHSYEIADDMLIIEHENGSLVFEKQ